MTPEEFGLWNYARSVSHNSDMVYLSGRQIARFFANTEKDAIYRIAKPLCDRGWFQVLRKKYRHPTTGQWICAVVRALDHEEWVRSHSDAFCVACPEEEVPVENLRQGQVPPVENSRTPVENLPRPVENSRQKLISNSESKSKTKTKSVRSHISKPSGQDKDLLASLAIISNDPKAAFDAKQSKQVIALRNDYSPDEIKSAFKEIWDSADDDFAKKHFARTFADRAPQVIAAQRRRAEDIRKTDVIKAIAMAQGRAEVEAQLAEAEKRRQEEANFFDPLLDSPPVLESVSGK